MFGTNPARPQELDPEGTLWVQEVFYTLQGEGPFSGEAAVFVRLAGCNLRCHFCDTDFESSDYRPSVSELVAVVSQLRPAHCELVVITGGEPFRQNVRPLVTELLSAGLRVQLETSGSLWVELPDSPRLSIVCSPKTAKLHPRLAPRVDVFKYVIAAGESCADDGLPLMSTQERGVRARLARPPEGARVYVLPRDDGEATQNRENLRAATEVALTFGYRLTLQMHKLASIP